MKNSWNHLHPLFKKDIFWPVLIVSSKVWNLFQKKIAEIIYINFQKTHFWHAFDYTFSPNLGMPPYSWNTAKVGDKHHLINQILAFFQRKIAETIYIPFLNTHFLPNFDHTFPPNLIVLLGGNSWNQLNKSSNK